MTYAQLQHRFVTWAQSQPAVRAAVVVGSAARKKPPPDEWSDLDLIVFVTDRDRYSTRDDWLAQIGAVWLAVPNTTGRGDPEWMVIFAGGFKVDFVLTQADATASLTEMLAASPYHAVLRRGMRALFDKNASVDAAAVPTSTTPPTVRPSPDEFSLLVKRALLDAFRAAKLLRRGEVWRAKMLCDCTLKSRLLTMIEWYMRAAKGGDYETWYDGHFLEQWADARILEVLPGAFATYRVDDLWRALLATLDLFHSLAVETAHALRYVYPTDADHQINDWLRRAANGTS